MSWADIESSGQFQAFTPDEQRRLKERYFRNVLAQDPAFSTAAPETQRKVYDRFMASSASSGWAAPAGPAPRPVAPDDHQGLGEQFMGGMTQDSVLGLAGHALTGQAPNRYEPTTFGAKVARGVGTIAGDLPAFAIPGGILTRVGLKAATAVTAAELGAATAAKEGMKLALTKGHLLRDVGRAAIHGGAGFGTVEGARSALLQHEEKGAIDPKKVAEDAAKGFAVGALTMGTGRVAGNVAGRYTGAVQGPLPPGTFPLPKGAPPPLAGPRVLNPVRKGVAEIATEGSVLTGAGLVEHPETALDPATLALNYALPAMFRAPHAVAGIVRGLGGKKAPGVPAGQEVEGAPMPVIDPGREVPTERKPSPDLPVSPAMAEKMRSMSPEDLDTALSSVAESVRTGGSVDPNYARALTMVSAERQQAIAEQEADFTAGQEALRSEEDAFILSRDQAGRPEEEAGAALQFEPAPGRDPGRLRAAMGLGERPQEAAEPGTPGRDPERIARVMQRGLPQRAPVTAEGEEEAGVRRGPSGPPPPLPSSGERAAGAYERLQQERDTYTQAFQRGEVTPEQLEQHAYGEGGAKPHIQNIAQILLSARAEVQPAKPGEIVKTVGKAPPAAPEGGRPLTKVQQEAAAYLRSFFNGDTTPEDLLLDRDDPDVPAHIQSAARAMAEAEGIAPVPAPVPQKAKPRLNVGEPIMPARHIPIAPGRAAPAAPDFMRVNPTARGGPRNLRLAGPGEKPGLEQKGRTPPGILKRLGKSREAVEARVADEAIRKHVEAGEADYKRMEAEQDALKPGDQVWIKMSPGSGSGWTPGVIHRIEQGSQVTGVRGPGRSAYVEVEGRSDPWRVNIDSMQSEIKPRKEADRPVREAAPEPPPEAPPEAPTKGYGKKNTRFTQEDKDDAFEELRRLYGSGGSQMNIGVDPKTFVHLTRIAGYHVEALGREAIVVAKAVHDELTEKMGEVAERIRPFVDAAIEVALRWPEGRPLNPTIAMNMVRIAGGHYDAGAKDLKALGEALRGDIRRQLGEDALRDLEPTFEAIHAGLGRWPGEGKADDRPSQPVAGDTMQRLHDAFVGLRELPGTPMEAVRAAEAVIGEPMRDRTDEMYDAIEAATNTRHQEIRKTHPQSKLQYEIEQAQVYENRLPNRPRTAAMSELQQFSTPLTLAAAVQHAAHVRKGETVLEPTAGTGNLVASLRAEGNQVRVVEIDPRRVAALKAQGFVAEQGDYLKSKLKADVIVTNPPWGAYSTGKYGKHDIPLPFEANDVSQRFLAKSLKDMNPGGRLVAVMPRNAMDASGRPFINWLTRQGYSLRALIKSPPKAYDRRGTDVESVLMVVDKVPMESLPESGREPIIGAPEDWAGYTDLVERLQTTHGRKAEWKEAEGASTGQGLPEAPVGDQEHAGAPGTPGGSGRTPPTGPSGGRSGSGRRPDMVPPKGGTAHADSQGEGSVVRSAPDPAIERRLAEERDRNREEAATNAVFGHYVVRKAWPGAHPHPRLVVESRSLLGVDYPELTYEPDKLVMDALQRGDVSGEQMDNIAAAGQAIERGHGILIADDVGLGKSREVAGILIDQMNKGNAKVAVLVTRNDHNVSDLMEEIGQVAGEGGPPFEMIWINGEAFPEGKKKGDDYRPIPRKEGVAYILTSYNFAEFGRALADLEPDLLIADEAHVFKGVDKEDVAIGQAWTALHSRMMAAHDKAAKFAYLTATPATSVPELKYLYGLRKWTIDGFNDWLGVVTGNREPDRVRGEAPVQEGGNAGRDAEDAAGGGRRQRDFLSTLISGAEQEQIMRELKREGRYIARDLWRGGVTFEAQGTDLTPHEKADFHDVADLAQDIQRTYRKFKSMGRKGGMAFGPRGHLQAEVKYRLFDARLSRIIESAKKDLAAGHQVVISLINVTGSDNRRGGFEAAIRTINVEHWEVIDEEPVLLDAAVPEAVEAVESLRARARQAKPVEDPIARIKSELGVQNVIEITGKENAKKRKEATIAFQNGEAKVAIISGAGKVGISLHHIKEVEEGAKGARRMYISDYEWSATTFKQELGRVDRAGQITSPSIIATHLNSAAERKFIGTIAARMRGLGAVSKGAEESTGTDALEDFAPVPGLDNAAMQLAIHTLPEEVLAYLSPKFVREDGGVLRARQDPGGSLKDFLLDLQFMPIDLANEAFDHLMGARRDLEAQYAEQIANSRTTKAQGKILRENAVGDPETKLYEVKEGETTHPYGVLSGMVTPKIHLLRGIIQNRRYVTFTDPEKQTTISGLRIDPGQMNAARRMLNAKVRHTPETAWAALTDSGDRILLQNGWTLRWRPQRKDIDVMGAKVADRDQVTKYGARWDAISAKVVLADEAALGRFLERYPIQAEAVVFSPEEMQVRLAGRSSAARGMTTETMGLAATHETEGPHGNLLIHTSSGRTLARFPDADLVQIAAKEVKDWFDWRQPLEMIRQALVQRFGVQSTTEAMQKLQDFFAKMIADERGEASVEYAAILPFAPLALLGAANQKGGQAITAVRKGAAEALKPAIEPIKAPGRRLIEQVRSRVATAREKVSTGAGRLADLKEAKLEAPVRQYSQRTGLIEVRGGKSVLVPTADAWNKTVEIVTKGKTGNAAVDAVFEHIRAGIVDKHGLPDSMKEHILAGRAATREIADQGLAWVGAMDKLPAEDRKTWYRILSGEEVGEREIGGISSDVVREQIADYSQRMADLGILPQEAVDRYMGQYLHRSYRKYQATTIPGAIAFRAWRFARDHLMGRGRFAELTPKQIAERQDDTWREVGREGVGMEAQVTIVNDAGKTKTLSLIDAQDYLLPGSTWEMRDRRANPPIERRRAVGDRELAKLTAEGWEVEGARERTDADVNANLYRVWRPGRRVYWRDYSKVEREAMGEIEDAVYAMSKTFDQLAQSIGSGTLFARIAEDSEIASFEEVAGWTRMSDETIPHTASRRWGKLAGMYVDPAVARYLTEIHKAQQPSSFDRLMRYWKVAKTAYNPVVWVNNAVVNMELLRRHGVSRLRVAEALDEFAKGDSEAFKQARKWGVFSQDFVRQELREFTTERHKPLAEDATMLEHATDLFVRFDKVFGGSLVDAYRSADHLWRFALFRDRIRKGVAPEVAAREAIEAFVDYEISAPWVNWARRYAMPFIAFPYRAIPVILRTTMERPWEAAALAATTYSLQALAMALAGVTQDEDRAKPERLKGPSPVTGLPRSYWLPMRDQEGKAQLLDASRWTVNLDNPLGGPLWMLAQAYFNKDTFTGQEIRDDATPAGRQAGDLAKWTYQQFAPPLYPGGYQWNRMGQAMTGTPDALGRTHTPWSALSSLMGVKVSGIDVGDVQAKRAIRLQRQISEAKGVITKAYREYLRTGDYGKYERRAKEQWGHVDNLMRAFGDNSGEVLLPTGTD